MPQWLFKQEPSCYSFQNLLADGCTTWDGVNNALAQKHLRNVKKNDRVFYYHTGKDKAVVGIIRVTADPMPDSNDPSGKQVVLTVEPVRPLRHPVTLAAIKAEELFASWELVRMSRLSVMPVSEEIWNRIEAMSEKGA